MNTLAIKKADIKLSLVQKRATLPVAWLRAAGLLQHHKKNLEKHAKDIRHDWVKK